MLHKMTMEQMLEQSVVTKAMTKVQVAATGAAVGGGFWAFFNENSAAIGALVAVFGGFIAFLTWLTNWIYKKRELEFQIRLAEEKLIHEIEERIRKEIKETEK